MAKSGLKHIDVGAELTKTEWESEESHEVVHGTSFPSSPVERQLFYRDDEHKWYIYNGSDWVWLGGGGGGMEVHGNEYHDPDFAEVSHTHSDLSPAHKDAATGVHGVGAGTIAKVGDIAVDSNLSAAAQDAIAKKHTQNTDSDLSPAHKDATTGVHGVGASTVESAAGSQAKVDAHKDLATGVHALDKSCRLWNNAAQSIPAATPTAITFNTEKWDTDGMHDLVSNTDRITCKTAGKYMVVGAIEFDTSGTGNRQLYIYLNGSALQIYAIEWTPQASNSQLLTIFCAVDLAVNDYLQLKAYQNSGGPLDSRVNDPYTPQFAAFRIA
jgi:hypothetical protein